MGSVFSNSNSHDNPQLEGLCKHPLSITLQLHAFESNVRQARGHMLVRLYRVVAVISFHTIC